MPATAGRVRMPANNRVHSSAALQTHGIWQSAIGYDPYAPDQKAARASQLDDVRGAPGGGAASASAGAPADAGISGEENAYDSFQGLLALARLRGSSADEVRGACKKCGRVGHLTFQCRNFLTAKEEAVVAAAAVLDKERGLKREAASDVSDSESEESESEISDSDQDPEMERAIAAKYGWKAKKSGGSKSRDKSASSSAKRQAKKLRRSTKSSRKEGNPSSSKHRKSSKKRKYSSDEDDSDGIEDSAESEPDTRRKRHRHDKEHRRQDKSSSDDKRGRRRHREERKRRKSKYDSSDETSEERRRRKSKYESLDETSDGSPGPSNKLSRKKSERKR